MMRHVAAAISLLAGIVFLGTASSAQVSRRLFKARRSGEKGEQPRPSWRFEIALPHDISTQGPVHF